MRAWTIFLIIYCSLFFLGCTQEEKSSTPKVSPGLNTNFSAKEETDFYLLIFQSEKKLELWASQAQEKSLLSSFAIQSEGNWRIGKYTAAVKNQTIQLNSTHESVQKKNASYSPYPELSSINIASEISKDQSTILLNESDFHQLQQRLQTSTTTSKVLILPNDSRQDGEQLRACYACPHWMAERYAQLELEIKAFSL